MLSQTALAWMPVASWRKCLLNRAIICQIAYKVIFQFELFFSVSRSCCFFQSERTKAHQHSRKIGAVCVYTVFFFFSVFMCMRSAVFRLLLLFVGPVVAVALHFASWWVAERASVGVCVCEREAPLCGYDFISFVVGHRQLRRKCVLIAFNRCFFSLITVLRVKNMYFEFDFISF